MKSQKLVLIIDDDSRNIFALRLALKAKGYQVLSCQGAQEGIELLRSNKDVDVVLMDMMMPEMDGYEALQIIRAEKGIDVPVVAVTAQAMSGDRERCIAAGAWEYVSKPIDIDRLVMVIESTS